MPELPEVEVTRRSFADRIAGGIIKAIHMGKPLRWPLHCDPDDLVGRRVLEVRRRGKYLLLDLEPGLLILHLGMSGSISFGERLGPLGKHDHFEMVTTRGVLRLNDPRRFGAVVYADSEGSLVAQKLLGKLGMEPLGDSFDLKLLQEGLSRRNVAIKQVLLAGNIVVGVGNIYASEVLFLSGIRPTVLAAKLSRQRIARLHQAIKDVLARAVSQGGTTLRDFSDSHGDTGHFQLEARVYGRAGQPCKTCGSTIRMIRQGQRSTFFCPTCQKP